MRFLVTAVIFSLSLLLLGCVPEQAGSDRLQVWVSIQPQKGFVEAVAGDHADVSVMVRPGQSPETYTPGVPQMAAVAQADIYFGIGMPLEHRIMERLERSMPQLRFVQTAEMTEHAHAHARGEKADLSEACLDGDSDPHVWMDPLWVVGFIERAQAELSAARPELSADFAANAAEAKEDLQRLHARLGELLAPYEGRAFYINHPSLGHFAQRYGLVQRSIEHGGSAPSARRVAELVASARADDVGAVFSQPEFGRGRAEVLARALDVEVIPLDVLSPDYFTNMQTIADSLVASFDR